MHKPIFILMRAENKDEAKTKAESLIEDRLIDGSFDWYQGIKESQRWPKYEEYDKPRLINKEIKEFLKSLINQTQKDIHFWLDKGLQEIKEKGDKELGWTLCNFHIASGNTTCMIFDGTEWLEGEGIRDQESLDKIQENCNGLWICGFDIHY